MQIAERIYERLQPDERFRAAVEAFGRRDEKELDRLNDACPYEAVRLQSPAYFGRLRAFYEIAMMHGIDARDLAIAIWATIGKLRSQWASIENPPLSDVESTPVSQATAPDLDEADNEDVTTLFNLLARLKAHSHAWAAFCSGLGVDPAKADFAYYREGLELAELFDCIEADQQCQTELAEILRNVWASRLSRCVIQQPHGR